MKKIIYILSITCISAIALLNGKLFAVGLDDRFMFINEVKTELISNNTILKGIIALLIILIFGYTAKLYYERRYGK